MKTFRTLFPMLGVALTLAACSGESTGNAGAESASSAQTKAVADDGRPSAGRPHHGHGAPGGPGMLLFAALHEDIKLTPEQKAKLEGLVASSRPEPPAADTSRTTQLASAVRSGKIEASTLQPPKEAMESAHKEHAAKLATSLSTLHDTLTKEQRVALVDAVKAKAGAHGPRKLEDGRPPRVAGHGPRAMGPMAHLLEGLDLTEAQKEQIKTKLEESRPAPPSDADREAMKAKFEAMKKDMDAKLESFKADAFDANAFVTPPAGFGKKALEGHADRMATDLQIVVSVLDQAQREKLAAKIEQGPPARPMRR